VEQNVKIDDEKQSGGGKVVADGRGGKTKRATILGGKTKGATTLCSAHKNDLQMIIIGTYCICCAMKMK